MEGEFKRDAEVWHLAALLLNPDTFTKGRALARALLAREDLEPAVVVWCIQFGIPVRKGRIKKQFGDLLRSGKGTPGHVAVLALMSSSPDEPKKGAAVIEHFAPQFPEAVEFFEFWRGQFLPDPSDHSNLANAIQAAMHEGDARPIVDFLATENATVEDLLAGGEALASRGAFLELNAFRDRLIATGTARGVEIAAAAALNSGDAIGSHRILERAVADGLDETPRLQRLKVSTDESLAKHEDLIRKLERDLAGKEDDYLRDRLLNAYLRVGDLDKVKTQAELAINKGAIPAASAVRLAYVLRTHAPETARRALQAVLPGDIPNELAPTILSVSSQLGLQELQQEMLRRLVNQSEGGQVLRHFDNVEEVIAMIEERAAELRQRVDDWLHGRILAVTALGADVKSLVLHYLSLEEIRFNGVPGKIPRVMRSGIQARRTAPAPQERPTLRLDFSGLLMADRFHLLEALEKSFDIRIPESLPEALMEVAGALSDLPQPASSAIRAAAGADSAVTILNLEEGPDDEIPSLSQDVTDVQKASLAYAIDQAFLGGHLTSSMVQELHTQFAIADTDSRDAVQKLVLSGHALSELARIDMLAPLSRGFPIEIRRSELQRLLSLVDRLEDEDRIRRQVIDLRTLVASKLLSSAWKTILTTRSFSEIDHPERLPAPMRCLLETLPTGDDGEAEFFWIEDRTLSKQPLPGGLDLPAVIRHLKEAGAIGAQEAATATAELRRIGYLFVPIDTDEILEAVGRAAIVGEELVENDEVAEIRRWFARDVLHLRYIDQTPQVDVEGRIVSEARRLIDLSNVATDLIEEVWKSEKASVEEMRARSNWIWSMLRLDLLPSPPAADIGAARRKTASLAVMQLLAIPVYADLANARLPQRNLQPFVDWAMAKVVDPFRCADPEAADDVEEMIAAAIEGQLRVARDDEPRVDAALQSRVISAAMDFLDLLPHEVDEGITRRRDLKAKLRRENVMLVDLDGGHRVAARDISKAISQVRGSDIPNPEVRLHPDGKAGTVKVGQQVDGSLTVSINAGDLEWSLHPSTVALVSPDKEERSRLLLALPAGNNIGNPITDEFLAGIAAESDTDKRVERFHRYVAADFASARLNLWSRISEGGSIQLSHLALPDPADLLNFLGLPGDFRGGGEDLLTASLAVLKDRIGVEDTVGRLCGLPVRLPEDLLREFAEQYSMEENLNADFQSLPLSLARVLGLVMSGLKVPEGAAALFSKERGRLFLTVLRYDSRQALRCKAWADLPGELSFCLLWLHANEMTKNLSVAGLDMVEVTKWLSERTFSRTLDREIERTKPDWVVEFLHGLSATFLVGAALAELLRHGAVLGDDFKALVGHEGSGGWMINPDLLVPRPLPPPEYWVGDEGLPLFMKAGWVPKDHPFVERDLTALLSRILSEVGAEPSVVITMIALFIDVAKVDPETLGPLRNLVEMLDRTDRFGTAEPEYDALANVIARVYRRQDDKEGFTKWILKSASEGSRKWPRARVGVDEENDPSNALGTLLNVCFIFTWAGGSDLSDRIATFSSLLKTIADAWPAARRTVLRCLDLLSREVDPLTAAKSLLPTMLELRSR